MSIKNLYTNVVKEYQNLNVNSIFFENSDQFMNNYTDDAIFSFDAQHQETIPAGITYKQLGEYLTIVKIVGFHFTTPGTSPQMNIMCFVDNPPQTYLASFNQICGTFQYENVDIGTFHQGVIYYMASEPDTTFWFRTHSENPWAINTEYRMTNSVYLKLNCT